jgi:LIM domain
MRAGAQGHVYHLKCFSCTKCGGQLMPGDRFCLLAGSPVCEQDWHKLMKGASVTGQGPLTPGKTLSATILTFLSISGLNFRSSRGFLLQKYLFFLKV